jgi:S1-C subfamily serine protease
VFGSAVDLVLIALIIMFALNGYRQGFVVGALTFFGFFGGALVGLQIAPLIVRHLDSGLARVILSLAAVFGLALLGQTVAAWAGTRLRHAINTQHGRKADDIGGIGVSVLALLLVSWMVAGPLGSSSLPALSSAVRNSAILGAVDNVMPDGARVLYNGLRDTIASGDYPDVFNDFSPTAPLDVEAPDPALANSAAVKAARASVVKITGSRPGCGKAIEGSGFVFAREYVMTNAHVVAGTRGALNVEVAGERSSGRVVLYDPSRDLAVVYVAGFKAPAMTWAEAEADTNDNAIVVGYPLDGPFKAVSARIREIKRVSGRDIYGKGNVVREVYTIRAIVRSGNSGGPLLDTAGDLLGVIFAAALDDDETGFALTQTEALPVATAGEGRRTAVGTGGCAT